MKKKLMQSYDVWEQIPRKCNNSSLTCVDKRFNNGQNEGQVLFPVQSDVTWQAGSYRMGSCKGKVLFLGSGHRGNPNRE